MEIAFDYQRSSKSPLLNPRSGDGARSDTAGTHELNFNMCRQAVMTEISWRYVDATTYCTDA